MKNKRNISILSISLASGGAEKVISLLLKKLVKDYNVTLVLLYNDIHFDIPNNVKVIAFRDKSTTKGSHLTKIKDTISFIFEYLKFIKKNEIEIAVSFLALPNFINSIAAIRFKNLRTIISERGFPSDNTTSKFSHYISKVFYPVLYNRNNVLFSNSVYINKDLKENFNVKIPLEVIYNPIDLPEKIVSTTNIEKEELLITNVGTLNKRKNQQLIINAVNNTNANNSLSIYGDGPLKNQLSSLIIDNELNKRVVLKGKVKNINTHLIKYNCFILSSNTEGFPNALLEAMAVGLPCISTNCLSGPLELLNDESTPITISKGEFYKAKYGLLINNNDLEGLIKAIKYYEDNIEDRIKYSKLAHSKAKTFELENIYTQFKKLLTS